MTQAGEIEFCDIAIVGGGISGVYTAFRLLEANGSKSERLSAWRAASAGALKVTLFEMSGRIGGRLLSATSPGARLVCELGGMRYLQSQTLVKSLIENELHLKTKPQVVDRAENIVYLRGKRLRNSDLTKPDLLPYHLDWNESGRDPAGLMGAALEQIIPGVRSTKGAALRELLDAFKFENRPLYQHGFWNVVARAMSHEAYALSTAMVGYDSLGANGNAVDQIFEYFHLAPNPKEAAIDLLIDPKEVESPYRLIVDGYETVAWKLRERFEKADGKVETNTALRTFEPAKLPDGSQGVRLEFQDRLPLLARAPALAMPQRLLRLLGAGSLLTSPAVQWLIDSVFPVPLFKMFLEYPFPWWESVGVTKGRSLTDTTVRQCYYWGSEPSSRKAVLMVYGDLSNVLFWAGLKGYSRQAARARLRPECC